MVTIDKLTQGDRVRLINFGAVSSSYRQKLLALGLTPGVQVSITRVAPLGCPIQITVRGIDLLLRKHEACQLSWEYI